MPMAELRAHCASLLCGHGHPLEEERPGASALLLVSGHTVSSVHCICNHCRDRPLPKPVHPLSKITPEPRNSQNKKILGTRLLFVLTKIQTSVNPFK